MKVPIVGIVVIIITSISECLKCLYIKEINVS
jgi:hypothetical protein